MPNKDTGTLIAVAVLVGATALLVMSRKVLAKDPTTRETGRAADAVVSLKVPSLGLTVKHPTKWKSRLIEPDPDSTVKLTGVGFALDDVQTTLACLRKDAPLPAGTDAAAYARHAVAEQVKTAKGNGVRILEERDQTIAGVPGRLVEMLVSQGPVEMQIMTVVFVYNGREHKIGFVGQKDFYGDAKPAVLKWLESIEAAK